MKKFLAMLLVAMLMVVGMTAVAEEEEKVLNLFSWANYVDEETLGKFQEETGIQVNFSTFASNEEMLLKLQASGGAEYDIIIASDYVVSAARKQNLLMELDKSKLTNWDNLDPHYLGQFFDPENNYSVPYTAGSPMIVYDPEQVEGEITSFFDLWDPQFEGALWMLDDARVVIGETLKALGYTYNTTDAAQLAEAEEKLTELMPNIYVFDYDMMYNYLVAGEVKAAYLFTPYAYNCLYENPNLVAVFPDEGIGFGIDSFAVPVNAPHPNNAHTFLDFYLRPDIAATVAEMQWYISPNQAAAEMLDPEYAAAAPFNIPEELQAGKEYVQDLGEGESLFQDIWTNVKLSAN